MEQIRIESLIKQLEDLNNMISDDTDDDYDDIPDGFVEELNKVLSSLSNDIELESKKSSELSFSIKVKVKKINDKAIISNNKNIIDLYITDLSDRGDFGVVAHFGFEIKIPENYLGIIIPKSESIVHNKREPIMTGVMGIIDSDYEGELKVYFTKLHKLDYIVKRIGDCIGRLIILPIPNIEIIEDN